MIFSDLIITKKEEKMSGAFVFREFSADGKRVIRIVIPGEPDKIHDLSSESVGSLREHIDVLTASIENKIHRGINPSVQICLSEALKTELKERLEKNPA